MRRARVPVGNRGLFPQHHEIGRAVFDVGDFGTDQGQAAGRVVAHPEPVAGIGADTVAGNIDVFETDVGEGALAFFAAGRDDGQAVGDAVLDVDVADVNAGDAAAVHAELEC